MDIPIFNSLIFQIFAITWGVIGIINKNEREKLMDHLHDLISRPHIFIEDFSQSEVRFYARKTLESIASALTTGFINLGKKIFESLRGWVRNYQSASLQNGMTASKTFGMFLLFVFLFFFLWADLIALFNTLEAKGFITSIPNIFINYHLAITFGSFFTVIVSAIVAFDLVGKGEFTDFNEYGTIGKGIVGLMTLILAISGLTAITGLGLVRYRLLTDLLPTQEIQLEQFEDFVITVLVPFNTVLSTALVHKGFKAIPNLVLWVAWIFLGVFSFLLYLISVLDFVIFFIFDILYRIILVILYIIGYYLLNPIDTIISMFSTN